VTVDNKKVLLINSFTDRNFLWETGLQQDNVIVVVGTCNHTFTVWSPPNHRVAPTDRTGPKQDVFISG